MHLSRLAALYPACRDCPHKHDADVFSARRAQRLTEAHETPPSPALFDNEGVSGVLLNDLTPTVARRAAVAFGLYLRQDNANTWPKVLLASDGRRLTAPLVAAAADGLRFAGCHVTDIGQATTGCIEFAMHRIVSEGGLLVGNAMHRQQHASLRFWRDQRPLSRDAGLSELRELMASQPARPTRQYGSLDRISCEEDYLAAVADYYHALRPLRIVLDTHCQPLVEYARRLSRPFECCILHDPESGRPVSEQVRRNEAHLGVQIDGNGDTCLLFDEQGERIDGELILRRITRWLLDGLGDEDPARTTGVPAVVLEAETSGSTDAWLQELGCGVVRTAPHRAAMHHAMTAENTLLGGGPSGRLWHTVPGRITCDALITLSLILLILSQSDRPFSQVLDDVRSPD